MPNIGVSGYIPCIRWDDGVATDNGEGVGFCDCYSSVNVGCGCGEPAAGDCGCGVTCIDEGCGCGESGPSGCDNECGSTAEVDDCGVCDGGNADDLGCGCGEAGPSGCDDTCGSTLEDDDCGVCGGDGSSCLASLSLGAFDSSGSLEVLYDFGAGVAGFQFDVTGLALTAGSGGAAGDAGMTVSAGGSTVVGFSMTNNEIPAGSGTLTVLSFSDVTSGTTELSLGNFGAVTDASGNTYETSASGSVDHGDPDCSGDYYGDLFVDECGYCGVDGIE